MKRAVIITATILLALVVSSESLVAEPASMRTGIAPGTGFFIVDARPLDAHVFLDGEPIGTARELMARALPALTGKHVIQVVHPGFRPFAARFSTAPGAYPAIIRTTLIPS
jgi:hypothetical protein